MFVCISFSISLSLSLCRSLSLFLPRCVSLPLFFSLSPSSSYLLYLHHLIHFLYFLIHFLYFLFPPRVLTYYGLMLAGAVARSASATAGKLHYFSFFFLYLDICHHIFIRSLPIRANFTAIHFFYLFYQFNYLFYFLIKLIFFILTLYFFCFVLFCFVLFHFVFVVAIFCNFFLPNFCSTNRHYLFY